MDMKMCYINQPFLKHITKMQSPTTTCVSSQIVLRPEPSAIPDPPGQMSARQVMVVDSVGAASSYVLHQAMPPSQSSLCWHEIPGSDGQCFPAPNRSMVDVRSMSPASRTIIFGHPEISRKRRISAISPGPLGEMGVIAKEPKVRELIDEQALREFEMPYAFIESLSTKGNSSNPFECAVANVEVAKKTEDEAGRCESVGKFIAAAQLYFLAAVLYAQNERHILAEWAMTKKSAMLSRAPSLGKERYKCFEFYLRIKCSTPFVASQVADHGRACTPVAFAKINHAAALEYLADKLSTADMKNAARIIYADAAREYQKLVSADVACQDTYGTMNQFVSDDATRMRIASSSNDAQSIGCEFFPLEGPAVSAMSDPSLLVLKDNYQRAKRAVWDNYATVFGSISSPMEMMDGLSCSLPGPFEDNNQVVETLLLVCHPAYKRELSGVEGAKRSISVDVYKQLFTLIKAGRGLFVGGQDIGEEMVGLLDQYETSVGEIEALRGGNGNGAAESLVRICSALDLLPVGGSYLMAGGWSNIALAHAMSYRIVRQENGKFCVYVYNTNYPNTPEELKHSHPSAGGMKVRPYWLAFQNVSRDQMTTVLSSLLALLVSPLLYAERSPEDVRRCFANLETFEPEVQADLYMAAQKAGNCTMKAINAPMLHILGPAAYCRLKLELRFQVLKAAYSRCSRGLIDTSHLVLAHAVSLASDNFQRLLDKAHERRFGSGQNERTAISDSQYAEAKSLAERMRLEMGPVVARLTQREQSWFLANGAKPPSEMISANARSKGFGEGQIRAMRDFAYASYIDIRKHNPNPEAAFDGVLMAMSFYMRAIRERHASAAEKIASLVTQQFYAAKTAAETHLAGKAARIAAHAYGQFISINIDDKTAERVANLVAGIYRALLANGASEESAVARVREEVHKFSVGEISEGSGEPVLLPEQEPWLRFLR